MATYDTTDRNAYIALGAVFGALAGIGIGMLTAPRSGRETRERMRMKAMEAKHKAAEQIAHKREMAMSTLRRSTEKMDNAKEQAGEIIEDARNTTEAQAARRRRTAS